MKGIEIGHAIRPDSDDLGIKNCVAVDPGSSFDNARIAFRPIGSGDRVEPHPTITDMDLQPIAVMLQLMRPAGTARRLSCHRWTAWMDESGGRVDRPPALLARADEVIE